MPNNWKTYKLGDIVTLNYGKSLTTKNRVPGEIPVFSSSGCTGSHNEALVNKEGIIIGRKGTVGSVFKTGGPFFCIDTAYYIERNDIKYDFDYLYYLLQSLGLDQLNYDSAVPGLNRNVAYDQEITLPGLEEQKAIASILSAIDDKIENNLAINKTLEDMAMALYKHWFVDFGPFQDGKFIDSELGPIPKGWEVKRFSDFTETTDYVANGSFKSLKDNVQTYDHEEYALYIRLVDYNNGFVGNLKYVDIASFDFLKKSKIKGKEVIISNVGANAGTVFRPPVWLNQPMTLGSNSIMILESEFNEILYRYFLSHEGQLSLKNIMSGSAQPKFNKTDFRNMKFAIPNIEIVKELNEKLRSIQEKIISNNSQELTLTKLRDTLLTKLIIGEVRLKEFQEEVKEII